MYGNVSEGRGVGDENFSGVGIVVVVSSFGEIFGEKILEPGFFDVGEGVEVGFKVGLAWGVFSMVFFFGDAGGDDEVAVFNERIGGYFCIAIFGEAAA